MSDDLRLSRMTLADRLFEQLRQQIMSGRLEVGQTLPSEQEIGEAFGVGRTTVREALHGLVSSGLVERKGRTLVVRDPVAIDELTLDFATYSSRTAVQQIYDVRSLLEVEAVQLAALNRTPEDLRTIATHLAALDTDDPERYHAADPEFHTALVKASGNEILFQLYASSRQLFFKLPAFWRIFGKKNEGKSARRIGSGHTGHKAIFDAVEAGDAERAAELAAAQLERVKQDLVASIDATASGDSQPAETKG